MITRPECTCWREVSQVPPNYNMVGPEIQEGACCNKKLIIFQFEGSLLFTENTLFREKQLSFPTNKTAEKFQPNLKGRDKCWLKCCKTAEVMGFLLTRSILKLLGVLWKRRIQQQHKLSGIKFTWVSVQLAISQHLMEELETRKPLENITCGPESPNISPDPPEMLAEHNSGSCILNPPNCSLNTCSIKGLKGRSWLMRGSRATRKTRDISSWWTSEISGA